MGKLKRELKKLAREAGSNGLVLMLYEGERVKPSIAERRGLFIKLVDQWRPDDMAMPTGVEPIPGYQRPADWREIEDRNAQAPGEIEFKDQVWRDER